jgi:hypothetical protein
MVGGSTIKAAFCFAVLLPSIPAISAQPGPDPAELPSGDVWPGGFVEPNAPLRTISPTIDDDAGPSPGNIQRPHDESAHKENGTAPTQINLDITLIVQPRRTVAGRYRAHRACR